MSFVPGYTHDIFVSYAQVDDLPVFEGEDGWVTALIKRLNNRLAQLLGRQDNFSLWFDHQLSHHVNITPEIMGTLEKTATLVVILSPGYLESPWCGRERDTFLKMVHERRGDDARVFLVERDKVELEHRPTEFGDLLGYRFWVQDRMGRPPRILGLTRSNQDDAYYDVLNDLAWELSNKLKQLRASVPLEQKPSATVTAPLTLVAMTAAATATATTMRAKPSPFDGALTVYLAEPTDDLDSRRTKLTRNLQQRNLHVIPDAWYPREPESFRQAVEDGLDKADLFVQLLSAAPGRKLPGLEAGYVGHQYLRAKEMGLPILQWRSPALDVPSVEQEVDDAEHRALLLGVSVQAVDIEDFCREIISQAEQAEEERKRGPSPDAFVFVNVDLDHDDPQTTAALCRYFEQHGIEYALPIQSGEAEEIQDDREANLVKCDGMIVVYGSVSSLWVRRQLRDFRELALSRKKKTRALAIYHGPPPAKDPLSIFLRDLMTIDCTAGMQESRLRPFLDALRQGVVV